MPLSMRLQTPLALPVPCRQVVPRRLRENESGPGGLDGRGGCLGLPALQGVQAPAGAGGGTQPAVRGQGRPGFGRGCRAGRWPHSSADMPRLLSCRTANLLPTFHRTRRQLRLSCDGDSVPGRLLLARPLHPAGLLSLPCPAPHPAELQAGQSPAGLQPRSGPRQEGRPPAAASWQATRGRGGGGGGPAGQRAVQEAGG